MSAVAKTKLGVATHLAPSGPLGSEESLAILRDTVDSCLAARETQLVIDLTEVPSLASKALEAILDYQDVLASRAGGLTLVNANVLILEVLYLTRVGESVYVLDRASGNPSRFDQRKTPGRPRRLGDMLVEAGHTTTERIDQAVKIQAESGKRMGQILVAKEWARKLTS